MFRITKNNFFKAITVLLLSAFFLWKCISIGIQQTSLNADLSRDLGQLSELWIHKMVWLGPQLRVGFPASPIYFYTYLPGLWLTKGNAISLVYTNAIIFLMPLVWLMLLGLKKHFWQHVLLAISIALTQLWIISSSSPWNGYAYVSWLLMAVISLWTKQRWILSSFLFGIAFAIHPASVLVLPIFVFEWYRDGQKVKKFLQACFGFFIPWAPIVYFEIISKGYLIRQWLIHHDSGARLEKTIQWQNMSSIVQGLHMPALLFVVILILTLRLREKRMSSWLLSLSPVIVLLCFLNNVWYYYLFGLTIVMWFCVLLSMYQKKLFLGIVVCVQLLLLINSYQVTISNRSISKISRTVDVFLQQADLEEGKTYALVSVNDPQNSTPQADDYRFFFRTKGVKAASIFDYPTADFLILIVETPAVQWQTFNDWHTEYFGKRELQKNLEINGITFAVYVRK